MFIFLIITDVKWDALIKAASSELANVTIPAPILSADKLANLEAPVENWSPDWTSKCPLEYLWSYSFGQGKWFFHRSEVFKKIFEDFLTSLNIFLGTPISTTDNSPVFILPGSRKWQGFGDWKVIVWLAFIELGFFSPVSVSNPLGISIETT